MPLPAAFSQNRDILIHLRMVTCFRFFWHENMSQVGLKYWLVYSKYRLVCLKYWLGCHTIHTISSSFIIRCYFGTTVLTCTTFHIIACYTCTIFLKPSLIGMQKLSEWQIGILMICNLISYFIYKKSLFSCHMLLMNVFITLYFWNIIFGYWFLFLKRYSNRINVVLMSRYNPVG